MTGPEPAAPPVGVVVMAYGAPAGRDDVPRYYTDIRRGRPPTDEQLADLVRRYDAIGGTSPLAARTEAQAAAIRSALDGLAPGRHRVAVGYRHSPPFVEDAVDALLAGGARRLVGLVLAPHHSSASVDHYLQRLRARAAAVAPGVAVAAVERWHLEPAYLDFLAAEVRRVLGGMPERTKVVFTAHSLPRRVVDGGDPYPDQLRATAAAVAARAGLAAWSGWAVAWQSAGRTPEPWLAPDVLTVVRDLAATGRAEGVVVCPCGFVAEHLEVLYDLDVEAAGVAAEVGLAFARTRVPGDDDAVMTALAGLVIGADRS